MHEPLSDNTAQLESSNVRVLIAASDRRVRAALRAILEAAGCYVVVAEASTLVQASALAYRFHPELILLDLLFPTAADGLDAVHQLSHETQRPIVVISTQAALRDAARAAGAMTFIEKDADADALLAALAAASAPRATEPDQDQT